MDWKEYPNLFCNGKFKIICHQYGYELPIKIEGYEAPVNKFIVMEWEKDPEKFNKKYFLPVNDCQLVARRIEDITDEEIENLPSGTEHYSYDWHRSNLHGEIMVEILSYTDFIYLLSIGVYPFDQSHFGKSVIDSKTLTQMV